MTVENTLATPITELFNIKYPVILAGMHIAAGPRLAAAVTNAGGLGVLGALACRTPELLKDALVELKSHLNDPNAPFGVDMALPKIGGGARKTNHPYHHGPLDPFIDVMIEMGCKLFVCAVGIPPHEAIEKFHKHGIVVMNMVGAAKHVPKALENGADMICAQGSEGGGHTGSTPTSLLIPTVVDIAKSYTSPLTGKPVNVVAAGGMYSGKSLAAALAWGANAVWVGTRFVASIESGAPEEHKKKVLECNFDGTVRTIIYTGRPLRVFKTNYVKDWEQNRQKEIEELTSKGIIPYEHELDNGLEDTDENSRYLMGETAATVKEILPAKQIVEDMVNEAVQQIARVSKFQTKL